jgi:hypothetical protein
MAYNEYGPYLNIGFLPDRQEQNRYFCFFPGFQRLASQSEALSASLPSAHSFLFRRKNTFF